MYNFYENPLFGLYEDPEDPFWGTKHDYTPEIRKVSKIDKKILRNLAEKVADISKRSEQATKRELWKKHNSLKKTRPLLLCFPENSWNELIPESSLQSSDSLCRACEWHLRRMIYRWEHFYDDFVIEPVVKLPPIYFNSGWGLYPEVIHSSKRGGASIFEAPIKNPDDISNLKFPKIEVDEGRTQNIFQIINEIIGDILEIRLDGIWVPTSLTSTLIQLRGFTQTMLDMHDRPGWVHKVMSFLCEGEEKLLLSGEERGLFRLNNQDDYVGSGGLGYTDELPREINNTYAHTSDIWGFAESQDVPNISPEMHREFILEYQIRLLKRFGLNCYGCCEPLDDKYEIIKEIPNLRRISVSPFADVEIAADALEDKYIFSWKPNPAALASQMFYPEKIRSYIRETLDIARECVLEIILKDLHTINNKPERIDNWLKIARELIDEKLK